MVWCWCDVQQIVIRVRAIGPKSIQKYTIQISHGSAEVPKCPPQGTLPIITLLIVVWLKVPQFSAYCLLAIFFKPKTQNV